MLQVQNDQQVLNSQPCHQAMYAVIVLSQYTTYEVCISHLQSSVQNLGTL